MINDDVQAELKAAHVMLTQSHDALSWPQRVTLAKKLSQALSESASTEQLINLVHLLARDPKWEVRKEVAESLIHVPDDDFLKLAALLGQDDNAFIRNAVTRALERRQQSQIEPKPRKPGLDEFEAEFTAFEKAHGKKVANQARQIAERMYDLLVGETVHEFRGLITPLKSNTSRIIENLKSPNPDLKHCLTRLTRMKERLVLLERLICDMTTYSQALSSTRRPERLSDVIAESYAMVKDKLQLENMPKVTFDVSPKIVVEMARHQIVVALANILKNGIESALEKPNSRVEIKVEHREKQLVQIVVRDNGPGRSPDDLKELRSFIPGRTTMKKQGTGFGLPIARRNVAAHKGTLELDSPKGKGFVVKITLPLRQEEPEDE